MSFGTSVGSMHELKEQRNRKRNGGRFKLWRLRTPDPDTPSMNSFIQDFEEANQL